MQEGKLLSNLLDYRVNERSKYKNYDPYLVMVGELRWQDVEKRVSLTFIQRKENVCVLSLNCGVGVEPGPFLFKIR